MINNTTYKTFNNLPSMKKLSRAEIAFLTLLRNGLDSQFDYTTSWLISSNGNRFMNAVNPDNFDDEFNDSKIREILIDLIIQNSLNGTSLLKKFYLQGSRLGYYQLGQGSLFGKSDKRAVEILTNYVQEVINSINTEYAIGIRETLRKNIDTPSNIRSDLINLAYTPIQSKIPVDTRCQFTARTEYARAVNTGTLQAFANYGVQKVNIITAGDERVCNTCRYYEAHNPFDLEIAMKLLPMHPNCYMPDTQVFTDHGWKYFYELKSSDKILSLNPTTGLTEFLDYVRVIKHKNQFGYMYHIHSRWFDTCVTPDHDCFVMQRRMVDNKRRFVPEFRKPHELNSESRFLRVINNDNISPEYVDVNGLKFKSSDYAFFMAWYISEGSVLHDEITAKKKNYPIKITQIKKNTREILKKELTRICDYLNVKMYVGKEYFELHSKQLYDYLKPLGYAHQKYIPNVLYTLSRSDLNIFLDNYILGDGHVRHRKSKLNFESKDRTIVTSSKNLVNGLSYLISLAGYYPSITIGSKKGTVTKHRNGEYASNHDCYILSINSTAHAFYDRCSVDIIKYDGDVYCVELPKYHTLWTKRNGKTSWNGNCRCSFGPVIYYDLSRIKDPIVVNLTRNHEGGGLTASI